MKLTDMNKKPTYKELRNNLVERFATDVDLDDYSYNQLLEMHKTLVSKMNKLLESNSYDYVNTDDYNKNSLFVEILEAEIDNRAALIEGAEDKAELVMASKDMVDRVTGWMDDTAEMQSETMLQLADAIRDELGADTSQQFQDTVKPGLEALYAAMEQTRNGLIAGVGLLTGEGGAVAPMGAAEGPPAPMDAEMGADADIDLEAPDDDDFGASAAAAGGEEPADRARRESVDLSRRLGMIMSEGYSKKKKRKKKVKESNLDNIMSLAAAQAKKRHSGSQDKGYEVERVISRNGTTSNINVRKNRNMPYVIGKVGGGKIAKIYGPADRLEQFYPDLPITYPNSSSPVDPVRTGNGNAMAAGQAGTATTQRPTNNINSGAIDSSEEYDVERVLTRRGTTTNINVRNNRHMPYVIGRVGGGKMAKIYGPADLLQDYYPDLAISGQK
jgi:hypothetical protein